jgi:chromosome segregation ATPase
MPVEVRQSVRSNLRVLIPALIPLYKTRAGTWKLEQEGEYVCGSAPDCEFVVSLEGVAPHHCHLKHQSGQLIVIRGSNRIWVNDLPVPVEQELESGDVLAIGPATFRIEFLESFPQAGLAAAIEPLHNTIHPSHVLAGSSLLPTAPVAPPVFAPVSQLRSDNRDKALAQREQQLEELSRLLKERESSLAERQQILNERAAFFQDQKVELERFQSSRLDELRSREADLATRQTELAGMARQLQESQIQISRTADDYARRCRDLENRESEIPRRLSELQKLELAQQSFRLELEALRESILQKQSLVGQRAAALESDAATIVNRQAHLIDLESRVAQQERELNSRITQQEQHAQDVRLQQQRLEQTRIELLNERTELERQRAESAQQLAASRASEAESWQRLRDELHSERIEIDRQRADVAEQLAALRVQESESSQRLRDELQSERIEIDRQRADVAEQLAALRVQEAESSQRLRDELHSERIEIDRQRADLAEQLTALKTQESEAYLRLRDELQSERDEIEFQRTDLAQQLAALKDREAEIVQQAEEAARAQISSLDDSRSVEQLSRIEAEREHTLRARQEAASAQAELQKAQAELERLSSELQEHRDHELDRQSSYAEQFTQKLQERESALEVRETQLAEIQSAALTQKHIAEAEREAVENCRKDLLSERDSLLQRSQDLSSWESRLADRERTVTQLTEELQSRHDALSRQTIDLAKHESELNSRGAELHQRVLQFRSERKALPAASEMPTLTDTTVGSPQAVIEVENLRSTLQQVTEERDSIAAEREALLQAVRDLQKTLNDVRGDLQESGRIRGELARQEQLIGQLYGTIEDRSGKLQVMESRLNATLQQLEDLKAQLRHTEASAAFATHSIESPQRQSEQEFELLDQIDALRGELATSAEAGVAQSGHRKSLEEHERRIEDLLNEIAALKRQLSESSDVVVPSVVEVIDSPEISDLRAQLERVDSSLIERDDLIRELRSRLAEQNGAEVPAGVPPREALQNEAKELDRRAVRLDERDEELRERERRINQHEDEVELQRRQLLDARQQLEIARAEIQVAMKQHGQSAVPSAHDNSATASDNKTRMIGSGILSDLNLPADGEQQESGNVAAEVANDIRSELINLFGLKKSAAPVPVAAAPSEFIDLSEAAGPSGVIALKFGEDASAIVEECPPDLEVAPAPDSAPEEGSDGFVRDYMEQLLARSRKTAGNTLPTELKHSGEKPAEPAPVKQAAPRAKKQTAAAAPAGRPKVKSFIEEYLAGGFADLSDDSPGGRPIATPSHIEEEEEEFDDDEAETTPLVPRQPLTKADLQKMRENLDSFRTLSTQSVEKALVDHAMRKERHAMTGRLMLTIVLLLMSVFLFIAELQGVINQPFVLWGTAATAIAAAIEFVRKLTSVKSRTKAMLMPEDSALRSENGDDKPSLHDGTAVNRLLGAGLSGGPDDEPFDVNDELPLREPEEYPEIAHLPKTETPDRYFEL